MTTDTIRIRSEIINTKVITNDSARQLGVVKNLLVDIDRREVVALGLRDNVLAMTGMPKYMYLNSIEKAGDVLLVPHEDVIEDIDAEAYSNLVNCEVITEVGELLGRVRDFQFNIVDGQVVSLIIASIGLPLIPEQVVSTYELPVEEIVSTGPNRIIVFEGSEERLRQLSVGWLERVGIGRAPWERDEEDPYYTPTARPENQLGTGIPVDARPVTKPLERPYEPVWDEDEYEESQPRSLPKRQARAIRYEDDYAEESNWDEPRRPPQRAAIDPEPTYNSIDEDVWDDDPEPYTPPPVNIPEKRREPEYEDY
jgi:sporulation protein YlmC with PRC-barrel domain